MVGGSARQAERDEEYGEAGWGGTGGAGREGENDGAACSVWLDAVNVGFGCGAAEDDLGAGRDRSVLPGPATVTPGSAASPSGLRAGITVSASAFSLPPAPLSTQVTSLRDGPLSSGAESSDVATAAEAATSAGAAPWGASSAAFISSATAPAPAAAATPASASALCPPAGRASPACATAGAGASAASTAEAAGASSGSKIGRAHV